MRRSGLSGLSWVDCVVGARMDRRELLPCAIASLAIGSGVSSQMRGSAHEQLKICTRNDISGVAIMGEKDRYKTKITKIDCLKLCTTWRKVRGLHLFGAEKPIAHKEIEEQR